MARPVRLGVDYFPKDVSFYSDDKVRLIRAKFGALGMYALDFLLCEIYAKDGYFISWGEERPFLLADSLGCGCTSKMISSFIEALVRCGFFSSRVFSDFGVLTSAAIQRRYVRMTAKREEIRIFREYWLLDINDTRDVPSASLGKIVFRSIFGGGHAVVGADSEAMRETDSEGVRRADSKAMRETDGEAARMVDSEAARMVDSEAACIADSEAARIADSKAVRIADSEGVRRADGKAVRMADSKAMRETDSEGSCGVSCDTLCGDVCGGTEVDMSSSVSGVSLSVSSSGNPVSSSGNTQSKVKQSNLYNNSSRDSSGSFIICNRRIPPQIFDSFLAFSEMRSQIRYPLSSSDIPFILARLNKLAPDNFSLQNAILDQSVKHGWRGVFELKRADGGE